MSFTWRVDKYNISWQATCGRTWGIRRTATQTIEYKNNRNLFQDIRSRMVWAPDSGGLFTYEMTAWFAQCVRDTPPQYGILNSIMIQTVPKGKWTDLYKMNWFLGITLPSSYILNGICEQSPLIPMLPVRYITLPKAPSVTSPKEP